MFAKNSNEPKVKTIAIDIDPTQLAKMTPAVTFAPNRIGTLSGAVVDNGAIYGTLVNINSECMNQALYALKNGATPRFTAKTLDIVSNNIFDNIVDSFTSAIYNHCAVYLGRVNILIIDIFGDSITPPIPPLRINDRDFIFLSGKNEIRRGVRELMSCSMEERKANFDSGVVHTFAIGEVNKFGSNFYNYALSAVSEALSFCDHDEQFVKDKVINELNYITASMMYEMTYECSAFCKNLYDFNINILSSRDINAIKYMNEPEKLDLYEKRREEYEFDDF